MSNPGSDHGGDDADDELAFPTIFRRLSQRAAAGGRGRLSHNPVMLDADFICFVVPASRNVMVDHALKAVWLDVWAACAGELLPLGLCVRESSQSDDVVADAARTFNKAEIDAVPDIVGCGTIPNRTAQQLPHVVQRALCVLYTRDPLLADACGDHGRRLPPHHPALQAYNGTKSFVFYLHEHAAHMPLPLASSPSTTTAAGNSAATSAAASTVGAGDVLLSVGSEAEVPPRCPSVATLKKICTRIMLSARAGAPLGLHGDFSLSSIGLTRQRRKVLRHVVVVPERPLSNNVLNLCLDEMYADHDYLLEKGDLERASIRRRDAAAAGAAPSSAQGPRRVPTPPPGPPMMRQVASQQRLHRFRPLAARFDWDSDDDSDDNDEAAPTPGDYEDFTMSRQQSQARVQADGGRRLTTTRPGVGESDSEATISERPTATRTADDDPADKPEAFYEAARHLSTLTFDDDAADEEFIPTFSRASDCTMRVRLVCAECRKLSICSSGYHIMASGCSGLGTHVVCADCMNHRVSDLIAHGFTSLDKVPCLRDDCFGDHFFDDFAGILNPTVRRFWCRQSMAAAREAATRDVQKRLDDAAAAAAGGGAAGNGTGTATAAALGGGGDGTAARLQREALL